MPLSSTIEAILFYRSEPLTYKELARLTAASLDEVASALQELHAQLKEGKRGLQLIAHNDTVTLGTNPLLAEFFLSLRKADQEREIGPAALETLALILYQAPLTRQSIDRIRGVNSSYILRALTVRGLITSRADLQNGRQLLYEPTVELLAYLGLPNRDTLPDREKVAQELTRFLQSQESIEETVQPRVNHE